MSRDIFEERAEAVHLIKQAIQSFEALLIGSIAVGHKKHRSKSVYRLLVIRQALLWRTKELADGAVLAFEQRNPLSAAMLTQSLMETVAVQVELSRIVQKTGSSIQRADVDDKTLRTLGIGPMQSQNLKFLNALRLVDQVDSSIRGFRQLYDRLAEYAQPSRIGVLELFSDYAGTDETSFGRYLRDSKTIERDTLEALKLSLYALTHFIQTQQLHMERFEEVCADAQEPETQF